jgi:hypothetical protein
MHDPNSQLAKDIRRAWEDEILARNRPPSPPPQGCCLSTISKGVIALVLLAWISLMASQSNNHQSPPQPLPPERVEFFHQEDSK